MFNIFIIRNTNGRDYIVRPEVGNAHGIPDTLSKAAAVLVSSASQAVQIIFVGEFTEFNVPNLHSFYPLGVRKNNFHCVKNLNV